MTEQSEPNEPNNVDLSGLYAAALPDDAPGAWIRAAIEAMQSGDPA